jgi:omega-hydroxy-beta-dihydromenaquinone-9 sulfotransferase
LTFQNVPRHDVESWKRSFREFVKKLTYKTGRPILLKSPPHTARIGLLLETFPDARFIHIHRNPYEVFQSTRRLLEDIAPVWQLQRRPDCDDPDDLVNRILNTYRTMYDNFFDSRSRIPRGRFHEIGFEELVADPVA